MRILCVIVLGVGLLVGSLPAQEPGASKWTYSADLLRPFWQGTVIEGESVLFIKDPATGEARAAVLFPVEEVRTVRNSAGDVTYEAGRDFVWKAGSREIVLPADSRIVSQTPADLRRPRKSQRYELTHRDGNGEIFFGGELEYAARQTCITYTHAADQWKGPLPRFDASALPQSVAALKNRQPLRIVLLGDSISAGANASALYDRPPFQPAYPELLRRHLQERSGSPVSMTNLAVGGTDTHWGLTQIDKALEAQPDLMILAFGMNDSARHSAADYEATTRRMIEQVRVRRPACEFILVASMLGNRDWITLRHEAFPEYRAALTKLCGPGIALADLTAVWTGFLELKRDWDQTGNGVNHPNDFGHRVYAQVLATLLMDDTPPARPQ